MFSSGDNEPLLCTDLVTFLCIHKSFDCDLSLRRVPRRLAMSPPCDSVLRRLRCLLLSMILAPTETELHSLSPLGASDCQSECVREETTAF